MKTLYREFVKKSVVFFGGALVILLCLPGPLFSQTIIDEWNTVKAPPAGEPVVTSGPDKFFGTDLEGIIKEKGIKTVIVTGTAAHGAVLYTASGAALRGIKVLVAVDGVSAENTYAE